MAERRGAGSAGGKLILCGEHAVVYGHPAIAVAIDRGTTVRLREASGLTLRGGDGAALRDARLEEAVRAIVAGDWEVTITSDLPIGRGMGSSAALAVALVRAWADATGEALDAAALHERAFAVERVFHGNPSGIDHAVSARGGLVRYRRTPDGPVLTPLPLPSWSLAVLDSGAPGDTRAMVAGVASRRPGIDAHLDAIGALVGEAEAHLDDPPRLGALLTENHRLLTAIGVSSTRLDALVALALDAGAHGAKLAGAGGGGAALALADDPEGIVAAARAHGVDGFVVRPRPGV